MQNHIRIAAALVTLCLMLTGCSVIVFPDRDVETAAPSETTAAPVTTAAPATTATPYAAPERPDAAAAAAAALAALPELEFDDGTLLLAAADETANPLFPASADAAVDRARRLRTSNVTERYGLSFIPSTATVDAIYTDVLAAKNAGMYYADLLLLPASAVGRFAANGLLRDLRNLPFWTAGEDDAAVAGGAVYADLGEAMVEHGNLPAVFFNRAMAEQLGYDLYAAVDEGRWTWELYFEASAAASAGDGVYGHALVPSDRSRYLGLAAASSGVQLVEHSAGQTPTLALDLLEPLNALDAVLRRIGSGETAYPDNPQNDIEAIQAFSAGKLLFCTASLYHMEWIFDSPTAWGILPVPSIDGVTRTPAGESAPVLCVPSNNSKFDLTGITIAALNAASTDVITDAYITTAQRELLRDWQSAAMIERIADSVRYDFATLYAAGLPGLRAATISAITDTPVSGSSLAQIMQARSWAANNELKQIFG